jgi:hypothetical protein
MYNNRILQIISLVIGLLLTTSKNAFSTEPLSECSVNKSFWTSVETETDVKKSDIQVLSFLSGDIEDGIVNITSTKGGLTSWQTKGKSTCQNGSGQCYFIFPTNLGSEYPISLPYDFIKTKDGSEYLVISTFTFEAHRSQGLKTYFSSADFVLENEDALPRNAYIKSGCKTDSKWSVQKLEPDTEGPDIPLCSLNNNDLSFGYFAAHSLQTNEYPVLMVNSSRLNSDVNSRYVLRVDRGQTILVEPMADGGEFGAFYGVNLNLDFLNGMSKGRELFIEDASKLSHKIDLENAQPAIQEFIACVERFENEK